MKGRNVIWVVGIGALALGSACLLVLNRGDSENRSMGDRMFDTYDVDEDGRLYRGEFRPIVMNHIYNSPEDRRILNEDPTAARDWFGEYSWGAAYMDQNKFQEAVDWARVALKTGLDIGDYDSAYMTRTEFEFFMLKEGGRLSATDAFEND